MRDWPEKPYLEPKTSGQTYLEWLTTERPRRTPTPPAPLGLEVLRQLYRQQPHIKAQLLRTARAYKRQGRESLHQWQWLPQASPGKPSKWLCKASSSTGWRRASPYRQAALRAGRHATAVHHPVCIQGAWPGSHPQGDCARKEVPMKIVITGSRSFHDYQLLCQTLAPERHRITQVITGGARGADQLDYRWAWKHQVKHQLFRADWERRGKVAGVRRNHQMAQAGDILVVFGDGPSPGTAHLIQCMHALGKPVVLIRLDTAA